ncbi:hypothetical protein LR48_Vigan09g052800 [Vigna angularis]|uniref:Benzyl alcohol O-benzoyltransferase n=2 Tax=Phaseolus angularis TaxID=3914 RepID=A0A0L9VB39_PHAAN|nr:coniferyl alcohol acyltransferase [Vigna angularis]KAG2394529.1 Benzyl alcohol O-benzoyltransferase [Vigna angularis]KOM51869.1 hypothetical protein LR48_Vigan09g052800 [Vigna angularis]BAT88822.1 hypothetical protein VIGAN_05244100 [Vigna angularis var. angularis]
MCSENGDFSVHVTNEEVVAAVLPMQEHWLPLSNLDLLLPPLDVGVFFCYKNPIITSTTMEDSATNKISFGTMVESLKKALAQTLISYYVFAGEVMLNSMGEPEVLCNNRGVHFVEAQADVELKNLNFYNPDQSIEGKFVPKKKNGVLVVQATSLKCGGIVVACSFDHRIADGYSANMFLTSWADTAHPTKATTKSPCFRRSLLTPRRPCSVPTSLHQMYTPNSKFTPSQTVTAPLLSRIYYVTAEKLHSMQALASGNGGKRTKLECFCALLWKMVARAASREGSGKRMVAKVGVVVDGRRRLWKSEKVKEALMGNYFGNVLSIPFGEKVVEELMEKPLGFVADAVHEFLAEATTEEHFLGLVDWVEGHRPEGGLARIYCDGSEGGSFVVSCGQRFLEGKMDFGWGKVVFGSFHFPWGGEAGYVMPMKSPLGNGDWVVYVHLTKDQLEVIECEAGDVFRPITWDYLNPNFIF